MAWLDFALKLREYHHRAVWEEQKHFTWLLSIMLAATSVATSSGSAPHGLRPWIAMLGGLMGTAVAVIGLMAQRREGAYYAEANALFVDAMHVVFSDRERPGQRPANLALRELPGRLVRNQLGVRDLFQVMLMLFAVVFAGMAASGIIGVIFGVSPG